MCLSLNFILCGTGVIQRLEEEWSVSLLLGMDENCLWTLFTLETHYSTMNNWPYPYIQTSLRTSYSWSSFSLWLLWPKMFVSVQSAPLTSSTTERLNSSPHSQPAKQLAFWSVPCVLVSPFIGDRRKNLKGAIHSVLCSWRQGFHTWSHLMWPQSTPSNHLISDFCCACCVSLLCQTIRDEWKNEKRRKKIIKKKIPSIFFFFTYKKMIVDDDDGICSMYPTFFLI